VKHAFIPITTVFAASDVTEKSETVFQQFSIMLSCDQKRVA